MQKWTRLDESALVELEKVSKGAISIERIGSAGINAILDLGKVGKFKFKMEPYASDNGIHVLERNKEYYIYYKQSMKDGTPIDMQLPFATEQERQAFIDEKMDEDQKASMKLTEKIID